MILRLLAIATGLAILISLGTWQMYRLEWKRGIIDRIDARIGAEPVALPPADRWPDLALGDWEYRPVSVTGRFDHGGETRVYTALTEPNGPFKGPGFWVMTPLVLETSGTVIVNRGFVPQDKASADARPDDRAQTAPLTLTGLLRLPERGELFTPDNDPAAGDWFTRDPQQIGNALGVTNVAPFTIDLVATHTPPNGLPQAGETRVSVRNKHLQYAITWYALAVVLLVMGWLWLRQDRGAHRSTRPTGLSDTNDA